MKNLKSIIQTIKFYVTYYAILNVIRLMSLTIIAWIVYEIYSLVKDYTLS